ncbi:GNAT family N-acetyltransferase [Lentzea sp. BCCO 10_0856]|uniref:GNAT family N-acetyltransferase n=1 Tax=Lentzea miocenica TaxID=3095431 RepID=A0ABU4TA79_9PSEU|nr:GNAT family N-acetyltransferase [Lentzea sp. BCCO 10_0856]MDX8035068.1 GNAT family N-acetyltransferase [Lentzea sp. BCCO 10_0856]
MKLVTDRGWSWTPAQWEMLLSLGPGFGAFDETGLLGTTLVTPYPEMQAISGVLVGSWAERRGIAGALISNILDTSLPVLYPSVLYATAMGEPLYTRLGFHSVGRASAHHGELAGAATGVTRPATSADLPAVVALDRAASGFTREAFWAHVFGPSSAYRLHLADDGFACTRRMGETLVIGPLVAPDAAAACEIIVDVAAGAGPSRVDVSDPDVAAFLLDEGYEVRGGCALMVHGVDDVGGDRARYFAPASLALG